MSAGSEGLNSRSADETRQSMQKKSFTAWANLHLNKQGEKVEDLKTDFCDGIKLIKLVEIIAEDDLGKYNKKPVSKFQKVENLNIPLKYINSFLKDVGIRNTYSAENVLEENEMLILGMVWSLILRFNVSEISEGEMTAKEGLLLWAKTKVAEVTHGKVQINNFHSSWQDGIAFNALIQAFRPDLADYSECSPTDKLGNLNKAFDTADAQLGIPKLLDAADMVSVRPDEKSVMTYISLFWKQFAANKRKKLAGEKISHVVQREMEYEEMQTQYAAAAAELSAKINAKRDHFEIEHDINTIAELEVLLREHQEYGRDEKPAVQQALLDQEALYSSICSRLETLSRHFTPAEETSPAEMVARWEALTLSEQKYEAHLTKQLKRLKKAEYLIKLFASKASKLEDWLDAKESWLSSTLPKQEDEQPEGGQAEGETAEAAAADGAPAAAPAAELATPEPRSRAASQADASRSRQPSLLDKIVQSVSDVFTGGEKKEGEDSPSELAGEEQPARSRLPSTSLFPTPALLDMRSVSRISQETLGSPQLTARGKKFAEGKLDSVSAVQAKLNMFTAYSEEVVGRKAATEHLAPLLEQITQLGCPPMRQFSLNNRMGMITERFVGLEKQGAEYLEHLHEELRRQQLLDEMRLEFAKRSESLNRWMEELIDTLTTVPLADSISEAQQMLEQLETTDAEVAAHEAEQVKSLMDYHQAMAEAGITTNPYSRFKTSDLLETLAALKAASAERHEQLQQALALQQDLDATKQAFASAAEKIIAAISSERHAIDEAAPPVHILQDDAESIGRGKEILAALQEFLSEESRERRSASLLPAQEMSDKLIAAAELENPYTRESISSLKTQMEQLVKVIRDKASFVEAQLARAEAQVSPEQYEEIKSAFDHFDKSKDGFLNEAEFSATLRSLDFELSEEAEASTFNKFAEPKAEGEMAISLESFTTFFLQQFKERDTADELISAFKTVAGGKDVVQEKDVREFLPEGEANYLVGRLAAGERSSTGETLEYVPFASEVYGGQ